MLYALAGVYLLRCEFSTRCISAFRCCYACLSAFDELAYSSFYPLILPEGTEEKGYTVSSMLYPVLKVLMMPVAAVLFDTLARPAIASSRRCRCSPRSSKIRSRSQKCAAAANAFSAPLVEDSARRPPISSGKKALRALCMIIWR